MERNGASGAGNKHATAEGRPNTDPAPTPPPPSVDAPPAAEAAAPPPPPPPSRTPFTSLSQVDADLALARALQEQERAYAMLSMNGVDSSDYESSDAGTYDYEENEEGVGDEPDRAILENGGSIEGSDYGEDAFDANDPNVDPAELENDEVFARALQDVEEREVAVRLMALAGFDDWASDDPGDHGSNSQDAWQEIDPDEYLYEELVALGDVVGTESRGLSADTIAALPSVNYKAESVQDDNVEQCVICRLEYEDGDSLVLLSCKHKYHSECINKWLQINKVCPVCNAEVSTSENKQD
ncbi:E3 ubiquitin-protein ligase [Canna indica]|uniref:E3 ubiquitin-protein ligase n=1 Tax=Canna indica TaxID=4628 RepID=A0AAQ3JNG2_9LILI|nr:E3 ubiquitin-protein ligase [Canna indica]